MNEQAEVRLGAQTGDAKQQFEDTAQSVKASLQRMADALQKFTEQGAQTAQRSKESTKEISDSFEAMKTRISGSVAAITGAVEKIKGGFALVAGALVGGALWKEVVDSTLRMQREITTLQSDFGMSGEKATEYAVRLKLAGSSADQFGAIAQHVGRMLKTDSDEFARLGVQVKDASGKLLPMEDIMQRVYERMQDFRAGTDQQMFALSLVGRSAREFDEIMRYLNDTNERAKEMMAQLNIEFSEERKERVKAYKVEMNAFGLTMDVVGEKIGTSVLPKLTGMAGWLNEHGPAIGQTFVAMAKIVITVLDVVGSALSQAAMKFHGYLQQFATTAAATLAVQSALFRGAWGEIPDIVGAAMRTAKAKMDTANASILKEQQKLVDDLKTLWKDGTPGTGKAATPPQKPPGKNLSYPFKPTSGAGSDDIVGKWRQELLELQMAAGFFREFDKSQEADFWEQKLALVTKGTREYNEVYRAMFEARKAAAREGLADQLAEYQLQIDAAKNNKDQQVALAVERTALMRNTYGEESRYYKAALDQELKLRQDWAQKEQEILRIRTRALQDHAEFEINMELEALNQGVALRQVSNEQKLAAEQGFEDRLYAMRLKALDDEIALLTVGTREYETALAQRQKLTEDHELRVTQLHNAAEQERQQYTIEAGRAIEDSFTNFFASLGDHTKTLKQKFSDLFKSIEDDINKLMAKRLSKMLFGEGTEGGGIVGGIFGMLFGGGSGGAFGSNIANAYAGAIVPSFAIGTNYVPRDGLAMIHRGEAIIPAAQNKQGAMGGVVQNIQFHISGPVDRRTQDQIALAVSRSIAQATYRNG